MSYLEQNLAIMRTRDPELAALMESDIDCSHIEVIPSSQPDIVTARVTLASGEKILLHNMEDPIGSAKRAADKQEMKAENASIMLGFGLGYLARELAAKLEKKHPIVVCEVDPAILKTALTHVDLSMVLDRSTCVSAVFRMAGSTSHTTIGCFFSNLAASSRAR